MWRRGLVVALVLPVVAAGAAACGGTEAGEPQLPPTTDTTSPAAGDQDEPPRSDSLDLAGIDPCSALTEQQLDAIGIDQRPRPGAPDPLSPDSPVGCHFSTSASAPDSYGFLLTLDTERGFDEYIDHLADEISPSPINLHGFYGVQFEPPAPYSEPETGNGACYAAVDVADGQLLSVLFNQVVAPQDKRLPVETLCAKGVEAADAALTTLLGSR